MPMLARGIARQGGGAVNRERFIRRFKGEIKRAADEEFTKRSITDVGRGGRVTIPGRGLAEPHLTHDEQTGNRDFVVPGNREFLPGDTLPRPDESGAGEGDGDQAGEGEGREARAVVLSRGRFF